jgi:heme/copper-type cytochrome/quinol oxidase subunit 3
MQIPFEVKPRPDTGLWNAKLGIWLFLASEVMLFGGLFSGYIFLRLGAAAEPDYFWPEGTLSVPFGFVNTIILILSSVFVVVAWLYIKLRDFRKFQIWMGLVVLCALVFLINKGFEYNAKFTHYGIKLTDNSIVEGHGIDDTIIYEGINEVVLDVQRFNGEFLTLVDGEVPEFREVVDGKPTGEFFALSVKKVRGIESRINEVLKKAHKEAVDAGEKKVDWLPAMGVKQLILVPASPFSIRTSKGSLRKSFPDGAKFRDQSLLKGNISAKTPGLFLHAVDRIDLRACDAEKLEDSLVWKYLGDESPLAGHDTSHDKDSASNISAAEHARVAEKIFFGALKQVEEEDGEEADFDDLRSHSVKKWKDSEGSLLESEAPILVPWDEVRLYSNFTPKWNTYYAIYFTLTGLHGLHVLFGAVVLFYFGFCSKKFYEKNPEHFANRVEVGGLFWHFVDLVWIFLFPILYLM